MVLNLLLAYNFHSLGWKQAWQSIKGLKYFLGLSAATRVTLLVPKFSNLSWLFDRATDLSWSWLFTIFFDPGSDRSREGDGLDLAAALPHHPGHDVRRGSSHRSRPGFHRQNFPWALFYRGLAVWGRSLLVLYVNFYFEHWSILLVLKKKVMGNASGLSGRRLAFRY